MDEEYLMALLEQMIAGQQQNGLQGPYTGLYGEGHPTSPTGQYRTHKTPYISDGNVPLARAFPNPTKFSADALFDVDPSLKPLVGNLVSQYGHDPYGVTGAIGSPEYQFALLQQALRSEGKDALNPADYSESDGTTVRYNPIDEILADVGANLGNKVTHEYDRAKGLFKNIGNGPDRVETSYEDVLRSRIGGLEAQLDDFITQAAPSNERNINMIDNAWTRVGGMPFPGINSETLDYAGSGPAFPTATQTLRGDGRWGGAGAARNRPAAARNTVPASRKKASTAKKATPKKDEPKKNTTRPSRFSR